MKAVDTFFLVDYLAEPAGGPASQWLSEHEDEPLFAPVLSLNEVYRGAVLAAGEERVDDLAGKLQWLEVLPFTDASAREAAQIEGELKAGGTPIHQIDILIAGTVRHAGMPLVTKDGHFEQVTELDVLDYVPEGDQQ
jgi:predicted nucleic acid-binding protein